MIEKRFALVSDAADLEGLAPDDPKGTKSSERVVNGVRRAFAQITQSATDIFEGADSLSDLTVRMTRLPAAEIRPNGVDASQSVSGIDKRSAKLPSDISCSYLLSEKENSKTTATKKNWKSRVRNVDDFFTNPKGRIDDDDLCKIKNSNENQWPQDIAIVLHANGCMFS
jgi:hypothetical protein